MLLGMFSTKRHSDSDGNAAPLRQQEFKKNRQEAHPDWQDSPQQALPWSGNGIRLDPVSRRYVLFRPCGDFAVVERLYFSPSHESQQRLACSSMVRREAMPAEP